MLDSSDHRRGERERERERERELSIRSRTLLQFGIPRIPPASVAPTFGFFAPFRILRIPRDIRRSQARIAALRRRRRDQNGVANAPGRIVSMDDQAWHLQDTNYKADYSLATRGTRLRFDNLILSREASATAAARDVYKWRH